MFTTTRPPEQLYFDGQAPPDEPDVEAVKIAIYHWLDRKTNQKRAGDETKMAHAAMLAELAIAGLDSHPYVDPSSGKKRRVWIAKEPKAKTTSIPKPRGEGKKRRKRGGPNRDEDAVIVDDKVESRRVPRKSVEPEIDPFGSTRESMAGGILAEAEAKQSGKPFNPPKLSTPKRGKGKRGK